MLSFTTAWDRIPAWACEKVARDGGFREWFSPGTPVSSTTFNWLVTKLATIGINVTRKRNSKLLVDYNIWKLYEKMSEYFIFITRPVQSYCIGWLQYLEVVWRNVRILHNSDKSFPSLLYCLTTISGGSMKKCQNTSHSSQVLQSCCIGVTTISGSCMKKCKLILGMRTIKYAAQPL